MSVYFPSGHKYSNINAARVKCFFNSPNPDFKFYNYFSSWFNRAYQRSSLQAGWTWKSC